MESTFFWLAKLAWLVISPDALFLLLILVCCVLLWRGAYRAARWLLGFTAATLLALALFPVGEWLLYPLETRFAHNPELVGGVDGIIVLSGGEDPVRAARWGQVEINASGERDLAFLALARRYPDARLVFTGGSGSMVQQGHKAADVAEMLFREQGLDGSRVIFERESRNTYENATFSMAQVRPRLGERWVLITSASHMPRALGVFCKAGWAVAPYPVDHRSMPGGSFRIDLDLAGHLYDLNIGVKEWVGLVAYFLTRKTPALLPRRCDEERKGDGGIFP